MSGIYIPGMEMPITCCHCLLMGYDPDIEWNDGGRETQGAYVCVITREPIDNTKREEHCPLIPVPDHGKLIEADAAKELMKPVDSIREHEPEWTWGELHEIYCKGLDSLPNVIPADLVKGGKGMSKEDILVSKEETAPKPITNADLIRQMTDEELAEWLDNNDSNFPISDGGAYWLSWLKSPADKEEK